MLNLLQSATGEIKDSWKCSLYITDLVLNPECTRLYVHGRGSPIMNVKPAILSYDLETKNEETYVSLRSRDFATVQSILTSPDREVYCGSKPLRTVPVLSCLKTRDTFC